MNRSREIYICNLKISIHNRHACLAIIHRRHWTVHPQHHSVNISHSYSIFPLTILTVYLPLNTAIVTTSQFEFAVQLLLVNWRSGVSYRCTKESIQPKGSKAVRWKRGLETLFFSRQKCASSLFPRSKMLVIQKLESWKLKPEDKTPCEQLTHVITLTPSQITKACPIQKQRKRRSEFDLRNGRRKTSIHILTKWSVIFL